MKGEAMLPPVVWLRLAMIATACAGLWTVCWVWIYEKVICPVTDRIFKRKE